MTLPTGSSLGHLLQLSEALNNVLQQKPSEEPEDQALTHIFIRSVDEDASSFEIKKTGPLARVERIFSRISITHLLGKSSSPQRYNLNENLKALLELFNNVTSNDSLTDDNVKKLTTFLERIEKIRDHATSHMSNNKANPIKNIDFEEIKKNLQTLAAQQINQASVTTFKQACDEEAAKLSTQYCPDQAGSGVQMQKAFEDFVKNRGNEPLSQTAAPEETDAYVEQKKKELYAPFVQDLLSTAESTSKEIQRAGVDILKSIETVQPDENRETELRELKAVCKEADLFCNNMLAKVITDPWLTDEDKAKLRSLLSDSKKQLESNIAVIKNELKILSQKEIPSLGTHTAIRYLAPAAGTVLKVADAAGAFLISPHGQQMTLQVLTSGTAAIPRMAAGFVASGVATIAVQKTGELILPKQMSQNARLVASCIQAWAAALITIYGVDYLMPQQQIYTLSSKQPDVPLDQGPPHVPTNVTSSAPPQTASQPTDMQQV